MECYYKGMKINFSKEVRAALRKFSKVDRSEYVQNVIAKQLAKDGRIEVPSDAEQKESEPVNETPISKPWDPVEANARYHSSGSVYCYFAGGGITTGGPVSDSEQKESEPVSEKSRVTTWGPVEGTVPFSYSCSSGSGSGFVGVDFASRNGITVTSGSPVPDSDYPAGGGGASRPRLADSDYGSGTGGNASQSN